jgi:hypothetical protein
LFVFLSSLLRSFVEFFVDHATVNRMANEKARTQTPTSSHRLAQLAGLLG